MTVTTLDKYIEASPDIAGGRPRISGKRITVQDIVIWHDFLGRRVDAIADDYHLTLAEVYAALSYYHDHRSEIDTSISQTKDFVDQMKQKINSKLSTESDAD